VAINSILQIVLYAPLAIFFINVITRSSSQVTVSYPTVAISVAVFLGIPLGAAVITRFALRWLINPEWFDRVFLKFLGLWSLISLLYTILVLFASQGRQVVHQIVSVVRVAAPLLFYFVLTFCITLWIAHRLGFGYKLSTT
jgi:ACR3 family arsenite transporter